MAYSLVPFILIAVSLCVIIVLLVRKFPQLTLLDVDNIPEVRVGRKKDELFKKRVEKKTEASLIATQKKIVPVILWLREIQLSFRKYVGRVERQVLHTAKHRHDKKRRETPVNERRRELEDLFNKAGQAVDDGDLDRAEEAYIAAIQMSPKSIRAYKGLAEVYEQNELYTQSEETYQFLLTIDPNDDVVYARLGKLAELQDKTTDAVEYYQQAVLLNDQVVTRFAKLAELLRSLEQYDTALEAMFQAVELEPQNPKYLDNLTGLAILSGDKKLAQQGFDQLRMVNPDNKKLDSLRDKIRKMR